MTDQPKMTAEEEAILTKIFSNNTINIDEGGLLEMWRVIAPKIIEAIRAEVGGLREALQKEWEMNHDERCSNVECPSSGCYHPKPKALTNTEDTKP